MQLTMAQEPNGGKKNQVMGQCRWGSRGPERFWSNLDTFNLQITTSQYYILRLPWGLLSSDLHENACIKWTVNMN